MSLEIHFHTFGCPFHSFVFFLRFQKRRRGERLTDTELPLFVCPLALGARAAGTIGRRLEEIKQAAARRAGTWPLKMPRGTRN